MSSISAGTTSGTALVSTGDTTGTLDLKTGAGATTALSIDASQRVGIGTSSPGAKLHVEGSVDASVISQTVNTSTGTSAFAQTTVVGNDTTLRLIAYGSNHVARGNTAWLNVNEASRSLVLATGNTERARIDSSGNVGIGTSSPSSKLQVANGALTISDATTHAFLKISPNSGSAAFLDIPTVGSSLLIRTSASSTTDTNSLTITSSGNVNIGSSAYTRRLSVKDTTNTVVVIEGSNSGSSNINFADSDSENPGSINYSHATNYMAFQTAGTERARIDSSGNVGIGMTPSSGWRSVDRVLQIQSSGVIRGQTNANLIDLGSNYYINNSNLSVYIASDYASRFNQYQGVFSWESAASGTAGNTITWTERMRIDASGAVLAGTTSASISSSGLKYEGANGALLMVRDGNTPFAINRLTNDGNLIEFYQATSLEGTISVSGTTVSYNGGHLSRWSQTTDNTRIPLVKGTVMSNLDQMANWDGQANEQLNCMKVSDVEGDVNVAGVFVNWDNDDDEFTNDMNIAMTGDMIIRIAQGTVVQRGDLLMSAGDGTAKPQGDDIVRSKTVAKVTSTHITCTYDDGSYCVPCVLMAC